MVADRLERARERVALLPTTSADDVAQFLRKRGVKGELSEPYHCPVAEWIADDDHRIGVVGERAVLLSDLPGYADIDDFYVELPKPVSRFVTLFDGCRYPELIKQ